MTFPQTVHAFKPDDANEMASAFQGFLNRTLIEAAALRPDNRIYTVLARSVSGRWIYYN